MSDTVTEDKKLSELRTDVKTIVDSIDGKIKIAKDGALTVEDNLFESTLPEGLTMDQITAGRNHTANFVSAGQYVFGRKAVDALAKNKELTEIEGSLSLGGKDSVKYNVERKHTYMNRMGANKDNPVEVVKHGICVATVDTVVGKGGQLKLARQHVGQYAAELLGGK